MACHPTQVSEAYLPSSEAFLPVADWKTLVERWGQLNMAVGHFDPSQKWRDIQMNFSILWWMIHVTKCIFFHPKLVA